MTPRLLAQLSQLFENESVQVLRMATPDRREECRRLEDISDELWELAGYEGDPFDGE